MDINPWQVDSIQEFSFLKCPECTFDSKEEESFQDHAIENHPLSFILFGKSLKEECFYDPLTIDGHKLDIEGDLNINEPENLFLSSITDDESFNKLEASEDYENHSNDVAVDHEPKKKEMNYIMTEAVHEGNKPYECSSCNKKYGLKDTLKKHIQSIHKKEKMLECCECDSTFKTRSSLSQGLLN